MIMSQPTIQEMLKSANAIDENLKGNKQVKPVPAKKAKSNAKPKKETK